MVPDRIIAAAKAAGTPTVEQWLDAGGDVNAYDETGRTLLLESVSHSRVELCRVLLARGADPSLRGDVARGRSFDTRGEIPLWLAVYEASGGLYHSYSRMVYACYEDSPSIKICRILIESGADVNALDLLTLTLTPNPVNLVRVHASVLARILFFFFKNDERGLKLATMLLRAGAHVESIVKEVADSDKTHSASWCLAQALRKRPELGRDEYFIKTQTLVAGVTEAGSYKKWVRRPHMKILGLRSLYARGRARLARAPRRRLRCYGAARQDHAIEFLVKLGDNGIVWNILSFWKETN